MKPENAEIILSMKRTTSNYNTTKSVDNNNNDHDHEDQKNITNNYNNPSSAGIIITLRNGMKSLILNSPSELWKAYLVKFLDAWSYFSFSLSCTLFLSSDFAYSDLAAGAIYGAWGACIMIFGWPAGMFMDKFGIVPSLRVGMIGSTLSRFAVFLSPNRGILLVSMIMMGASQSLGVPVLTVAMRRYTKTNTGGDSDNGGNVTNGGDRSFAFGLFYVVMNIAALFAGPTVDICTRFIDSNNRRSNMDDMMKDLGNHDDGTGDLLNQYDLNSTFTQIHPSWTLSEHRLVILVGVFASALAFVVSLTMREIDPASTSATVNDCNIEDRSDNSNSDHNSNNNSGIKINNNKQGTKSLSNLLKNDNNDNALLLRDPNFRRLMIVSILTVNVRTIFRHLDATLPKYMVREFGPDAPRGAVYAINPFLIILLVPPISAYTSSYSPLDMIRMGSYVSSCSVFFLAFSTSIPACVAFVSVLSVGEAIWSPRLNDYAMGLAREGKEGAYVALSNAPMFLAKLPAGMLSGYLLQRFCPEEGVRESRIMWFIIGCVTVISPIMLTVWRTYLSSSYDDGREDSRHGVTLGRFEKIRDTDDVSVDESIAK